MHFETNHQSHANYYGGDRKLSYPTWESPNLEDCEKRFVVNRIVNRKEEKKILKMLNEAGVTYIHIPFIREEYLQIGWDIKDTPPEYAPFSIGFSLLGENFTPPPKPRPPA